MKSRGMNKENEFSKHQDFTLFHTVILKLEKNQELLMENHSKMDAILNNKIEMIVETQDQKNAQFEEDIIHLKEEIHKLKPKPGGSVNRARSVNIATKRSSARGKQPTAEIHRTGTGERGVEDIEWIISEDENGRFNCPVCAKNLSASYIRLHLTKFCLKSKVRISKVRHGLAA